MLMGAKLGLDRPLYVQYPLLLAWEMWCRGTSGSHCGRSGQWLRRWCAGSQSPLNSVLWALL